jgi:Tfp pilus assembly PilM family ATPase
MSLALNDAPPPAVAVEIGSRRVAAAVIERRGGQPVIGAHAIEALPEGALVPSLTAPNVRDPAIVSAALGRVLERVGRPRRVGLVIPDPVAKVSLVRFEQVPARAQDLGQLIRWQVRKAAPFALDEAQVSYVDAGLVTGGHEFVVTLARRDIVQEYEGLVAAHGAHAGIVDISTFNVINAVLAGAVPPAAGSESSQGPSRDDWLLVNVAPDWASIAILRGPQLIFFRTRSADADGTLADLVHQTSMYYEDRLEGAGLTRAVLCGGLDAAGGDDPRRSLEERLALPIDSVDVQAAVALTDRITAGPALLDTLAPLTGLLLRAGERAA